MACGPARDAIGVFQEEPPLGAATDPAAAWACGEFRLWDQTVDRDLETPVGHILKRRAAREFHVQKAVHTG